MNASSWYILRRLMYICWTDFIRNDALCVRRDTVLRVGCSEACTGRVPGAFCSYLPGNHLPGCVTFYPWSSYSNRPLCAALDHAGLTHSNAAHIARVPPSRQAIAPITLHIKASKLQFNLFRTCLGNGIAITSKTYRMHASIYDSTHNEISLLNIAKVKHFL